jgi:hypothetical protein
VAWLKIYFFSGTHAGVTLLREIRGNLKRFKH